MIKNERQYRITKAQTEKFATALQELRTKGKGAQHPQLYKAQLDAMHSQWKELQKELAEYEALRSGKRIVLALDSLERVAQVLIQARIAAGLSQEELAAKLGLKSQQIQRYEANDYQSANLERIAAILRVLRVQWRQPAELRLASEAARA